MPEVQRRTNLQELRKETPVKGWRQMLGAREKQGISPYQLEVKQKHLKVQGVQDIRDVAARSDSE